MHEKKEEQDGHGVAAVEGKRRAAAVKHAKGLPGVNVDEWSVDKHRAGTSRGRIAVLDKPSGDFGNMVAHQFSFSHDAPCKTSGQCPCFVSRAFSQLKTHRNPPVVPSLSLQASSSQPQRL